MTAAPAPSTAAPPLQPGRHEAARMLWRTPEQAVQAPAVGATPSERKLS